MYLNGVYAKSFIIIGNIESRVSTNVVRGVIFGKTNGANSFTSPELVVGPVFVVMPKSFAATLSPTLYNAQKLGAQ